MLRRKSNLTPYFSLMMAVNWVAACCVVGFISVFLSAVGFSNTEIGVVVMFANLIPVLLQPFLSAACDRFAALTPRRIILCFDLFGALDALLLFCLPVGKQAAGAMFLLLIVCKLLSQPFFTVLAMQQGADRVNYSVGRGIASFSYAVSSTLLGLAIRAASAKVLLPPLAAAWCLTAFLVSRFPEDAPPPALRTRSASKLMDFVRGNPRFIGFVASATMVYFGQVFMNTYNYQLVQRIGGDAAQTGLLFGLSAAMELPGMTMVPLLLRRVKAKYLLVFAACVYILKILLVLWATSFTGFAIAQLLQVFSFSILLPAGIFYTESVIDPADRAKGQSLFDLSFPMSSIFAALLGGLLMDAFGLQMALTAAAGITAAGTACMAALVLRR